MKQRIRFVSCGTSHALRFALNFMRNGDQDISKAKFLYDQKKTGLTSIDRKYLRLGFFIRKKM